MGAGRDLRLLLVALAAVLLQPLAGLVAVAVAANVEAARRFLVGWRSAHPAQPRATPAALALARVEPPSPDVMPLPAARAVSARSVEPRR